MREAVILFALSLAGCADGERLPDRADVVTSEAAATDAQNDAWGDVGSTAFDAGNAGNAGDAGDVPVVTDAPLSAIAPSTVNPEATTLRDGANTVSAELGVDFLARIEAQPNEHIGFVLTFTPTTAAATLHLERWSGVEAQQIGVTDARLGQRFLAAFDPTGPRTFWVRVRTTATRVEGALTVTRTPFHDDAHCVDDCDRLLQLPVPNEPAMDGYISGPSTVFRYQFGRRDMLMFLRHAGHTMASQGRVPFAPEDLSQWNGLTPGSDVGALRHASHQRGKDVDLSLYGADGQAPWRSYCTTVSTADGRECMAGTVRNFDANANAHMLADWFASGRVTMMFLDRALIALVRPAAMQAVNEGTIDRALLSDFTDGVHLQHWPNHDNHVHVRVSEAAVGVSSAVDPRAAIEAP